MSPGSTLPPDLRLNVAIATFERGALLARTLDSLAEARRPAGFERVLVVENGASREGRSVCEARRSRLPLEYHHIGASGKSRALQWAMEHLGDGLALFLDDDVRVGEGLLDAYAAAVHKHGRDRFYGGPLRVDQEEPPPDWLRPFLPSSAVGWTPRNPDVPFVRRERFLGANYAAFVEDVLAVGSFREDIGPGARRPGTAGNPSGQERELQERLMRAGLAPVYVPDAEVWHYVPRDRCTQAWALHRAFRHRYSRILLRELEGEFELPRWRDVPLRTWGRLVRSRTRASLAKLASDPAARYRAERRLHKTLGEIEGHRAGVRARAAAAAPDAIQP